MGRKKCLMPFFLTACVLCLTAAECGTWYDEESYFKATIDSKEYATEGRRLGMNYDIKGKIDDNSMTLKMSNLKYQGGSSKDSLRVSELILALHLTGDSVIEPGKRYNIGDDGVDIEFSFIRGYYETRFDLMWEKERTYASKGWIEISLYDQRLVEGKFFFDAVEFLMFDPEKRDGQYHTATFDVNGSFLY